jgi:hypothetical protein
MLAVRSVYFHPGTGLAMRGIRRDNPTVALDTLDTLEAAMEKSCAWFEELRLAT